MKYISFSRGRFFRGYVRLLWSSHLLFRLPSLEFVNLIDSKVLFWLQTTKKAFTKIIPGHISLMLYCSKRELILSQKYLHFYQPVSPSTPIPTFYGSTLYNFCDVQKACRPRCMASWCQFTQTNGLFGMVIHDLLERLDQWDPTKGKNWVTLNHLVIGFLWVSTVSTIQKRFPVRCWRCFFHHEAFLEIREIDFSAVSKFWGDFNSIACMYPLKDGHIVLCINIGSVHITGSYYRVSRWQCSGIDMTMGIALSISRHPTNDSGMMWFPKCLGASLTSYAMHGRLPEPHPTPPPKKRAFWQFNIHCRRFFASKENEFESWILPHPHLQEDSYSKYNNLIYSIYK